MKVTVYNELSPAGNSRVIAVFNSTALTVTAALDEAASYSRKWNRSETRKDMRANLISANGFVRAV